MAPVMVYGVDQMEPPTEPIASQDGDRPWSYDRAVTRGFFQGMRPVDGPLIDRRSVPWLVASIAIWVVGLVAYQAPLPLRLAIVVALIAGFMVLLRAFLVSWRMAMIRAHLSVVDRPELGEVRRWLVFGRAFLGYPLLVLILLFVGPLTIQRLVPA